MKKILTFILFSLLTISIKIQGQFIVNAGNDTIICANDTAVLGGNPTASGGTEPYTYAWSTNYNLAGLSFKASIFLDDTTLANPTLKTGAENKITFKVNVSDHNGIQKEDSVSIRFSRFFYLADDNFAIINQGDTAILWSVIGKGIEPLSYIWTPNYNISDTSIACPKAWPDINTDYQAIAIDSIGCISESDIFWIHVIPSGIRNTSNKKSKSNVYPNPISNNSSITINNVNQGKLTIHIINGSGQFVLNDDFIGNEYKIGDKIIETGVYIFIIKNDKNIISSGQFIKN